MGLKKKKWADEGATNHKFKEGLLKLNTSVVGKVLSALCEGFVEYIFSSSEFKISGTGKSSLCSLCKILPCCSQIASAVLIQPRCFFLPFEHCCTAMLWQKWTKEKAFGEEEEAKWCCWEAAKRSKEAVFRACLKPWHRVNATLDPFSPTDRLSEA